MCVTVAFAECRRHWWHIQTDTQSNHTEGKKNCFLLWTIINSTTVYGTHFVINNSKCRALTRNSVSLLLASTLFPTLILNSNAVFKKKQAEHQPTAVFELATFWGFDTKKRMRTHTRTSCNVDFKFGEFLPKKSDHFRWLFEQIAERKKKHCPVESHSIRTMNQR